jgi:hypothetical protein
VGAAVGGVTEPSPFSVPGLMDQLLTQNSCSASTAVTPNVNAPNGEKWPKNEPAVAGVVLAEMTLRHCE